jgi:hypothetical protein
MNTAFTAVQAVIGAAMLFRRTARPALIASIAWALAVWAVGEGFGGVMAGMGSVIAGGPGAALIYAVLAAAVLGGGHEAGPKAFPPEWVPGVWAALWLLLLLTGPWPGQTTAAALAGQLTGEATSLPATLSGAVVKVGVIASQHSLPVTSALALAEATVALGALRPGLTRDLAAASGVVVAILAWLTGQAMGGLPSGRATDVGTGPPLVLLALAVWAAAERPTQAGACRDSGIARPRAERDGARRASALLEPDIGVLQHVGSGQHGEDAGDRARSARDHDEAEHPGGGYPLA